MIQIAYYERRSDLKGSPEKQNQILKSINSDVEAYIASIPGGVSAGVFLEWENDSGERERPALQRLLEVCREKAVDWIMTESLHGLARSTSDCAAMVRLFSEQGIGILFQKEKICTIADKSGSVAVPDGYSPMEAELLIRTLGGVASHEARSRSDYMKRSVRERFEQGTYRQAISPYGYEWVSGKLTVVPGQAKVVREIFDMVLTGRGAGMITRELNARNIPSPSGKRWTQTALSRLIANPVYAGDAVYQRTYKDDRLRQRRNRGELPQYVVEGHHEAIIPAVDFQNAQAAVK